MAGRAATVGEQGEFTAGSAEAATVGIQGDYTLPLAVAGTVGIQTDYTLPLVAAGAIGMMVEYRDGPGGTEYGIWPLERPTQVQGFLLLRRRGQM